MKNTIKKFLYIILVTVFFMVMFPQNKAIAVTANDDEKIYTIEDIVYNRVPVFDINVFSNTAGGQDVEDNSVVSTIRKVVATWYVAIRNVVAVFLGILLIYTGIRMAIATVASDRAKYKEFLIGWIKSIIILFTINYVMVIVLNLNDVLVSLFSNGNSAEITMYETIRTRAYDFRFSIGMPGMIMYITMVIIFARFVWLYVKRTFTVLILIVLAPVISAKYAFDSASGKRSRVFSEWLYQFSANVLIQAVHALAYTSIVGISLDVSTENITGFIIALIFLNFMLSADKIALRIFKFDGYVQDIEKAFKKEENLAGVYYAYGAVKLAKKGREYVGDKVKTISYSPSLREIERATRNIKNKIANSIDNAILSINSTMIDKMEDSVVNGGKSYDIIKRTINKKINSANNILILKKASRRQGTAGDVARQTLKLRKEQNRSVYKSNYKFIKNNIKGVGSVVLAVPVMVVNPSAGIGLAFSGVKDLKANAKAQKTRKYSRLEKVTNAVTLGQYVNRTEDNISNEKKNKKIENTMSTMLEVNKTMDKIEHKIGQYDDATKAEAKSVLKAHYMSDAQRVSKYMTNYMSEIGKINMDVANIDENTQEEMIDYIVGIIDRGRKLGETQKNEIIKQIKGNLKNNRYGEDRKNNMKLFASTVQDTVRFSVNGNRFSSEINLVSELEEKNKKLFDSINDVTEEDSTVVIDIENYIDTL